MNPAPRLALAPILREALAALGGLFLDAVAVVASALLTPIALAFWLLWLARALPRCAR